MTDIADNEIFVRMIKRRKDEEQDFTPRVKDVTRQEQLPKTGKPDNGFSLTRIKYANAAQARAVYKGNKNQEPAVATKKILEEQGFIVFADGGTSNPQHASLLCGSCDKRLLNGQICAPSDGSRCPLFDDPDVADLLISIFELKTDAFVDSCFEREGIAPGH